MKGDISDNTVFRNAVSNITVDGQLIENDVIDDSNGIYLPEDGFVDVIKDHARPPDDGFGEPIDIYIEQPDDAIIDHARPPDDGFGEPIDIYDEQNPDDGFEIVDTTDTTVDTDTTIDTGGGGGSFIENETNVAQDGGFIQKAKGLKVGNYVYPYTFLAITLAGGGIGFGVSKVFKQNIIGYLTLIAAGLMAGSAIAFKIKAPIKLPTNDK